MDAPSILMYGHKTVLQTINGLPEAMWLMPGACGIWSVKDIIAHLASHEHVLVDVLTTFVAGGPAPYLEQLRTQGERFNDLQVTNRQHQTVAKTLQEYTNTYGEVEALIRQIPAEVLRQPGSIPWYGEEYALDDFLVYGYYGHKREHSAQIAAFRDRITHS